MLCSLFYCNERSLAPAAFFFLALTLAEKSFVSSSSIIVLSPPNISRGTASYAGLKVVVCERLFGPADLKLVQSRSNSSSFSREPLNLISKSFTSSSLLVWLLLAIISRTLLPPREWDLFCWLVSRIWSNTWLVLIIRSLLCS